jgi:hypothetical protein
MDKVPGVMLLQRVAQRGRYVTIPMLRREFGR